MKGDGVLGYRWITRTTLVLFAAPPERVVVACLAMGLAEKPSLGSRLSLERSLVKFVVRWFPPITSVTTTSKVAR